MKFALDAATQEFAEEARQWLSEHVPSEPRPHESYAARAFDAEWQAEQFRGGWAGVAWPQEYGGKELSPARQIIWYEECIRAGAPVYSCFLTGLGHAGPTLMAQGTEQQRSEYLPRILRGENVWSQGFSEPGSGSDLASLRTSAVIDGDHLVVNGSKIWTSHAHISDFQELLVRTDNSVPRHNGISWVICDMRTPGIDIRPIRTLDGYTQYCEVFYDDVRIPIANIVGGLNNGWGVAMSTLQFERGIGYLLLRLGQLEVVDDLIVEAGRRNLLRDSSLADDLQFARAQALAVRALGYDAISGATNPTLVSAVNQLFHGELAQLIGRLTLRVRGTDTLRLRSGTDDWLASFRLSIVGGTKDIQKNIIAERVLGLPR